MAFFVFCWWIPVCNIPSMLTSAHRFGERFLGCLLYLFRILCNAGAFSFQSLYCYLNKVLFPFRCLKGKRESHAIMNQVVLLREIVSYACWNRIDQLNFQLLRLITFVCGYPSFEVKWGSMALKSLWGELKVLHAAHHSRRSGITSLWGEREVLHAAHLSW